MAEIGTAYVKVVPVLDEDAVDAIRRRLDEVLADPRPAKIRPPDPLTIRLPDSMAATSPVQIRALDTEWREVFPGLQAQVNCEAGDIPGLPVTVLFRLTPQTCPGGC